MGQLTFAGAMSHAPGIAAFAEAAPQPARERFFAATEVLRTQFKRSHSDLLLVIAPDHFSNFFVDNMPAACVSMNEFYPGPIEDWLGMPKMRLQGHPAFARSVLDTAFGRGFEPAFSEQLELDHGVMIALKHLTPEFDVPIVWVMQNCQVPPLMSLRRCYDFGKVLRQAIDASDLRVGVLGTGGLSHTPGGAEADQLDPEFDEYFLDLLEQGDPQAICAIPSERIDEAGFGAWEIRQWITTLGVAHDRKPRKLAYEAVVEWDTGCGVAIYE